MLFVFKAELEIIRILESWYQYKTDEYMKGSKMIFFKYQERRPGQVADSLLEMTD